MDSVVDNCDTESLVTEYDITDWQKYYSSSCLISGKHVKVSDESYILVVISTPVNPKQDAKKIVLIPGWFSQPSGWQEIIKTVSEKFETVYIETREKNSSIVSKQKSTQMGIEQMANDVEEVLRILNIHIPNTICVGSSLGGSTLLQLLLINRAKPYKTILIGPNPDFKLPPIIGRILLAMPLFMIGMAKKYIKWHLLKFRLDPKKEPEQAKKYIEIFDAADSWKVKQSGKHVTKFNAWGFLSSIKADVIVVGASMDKLHASERTLRVGKKIENSQYIDFRSNKATHSKEFGEFIISIANRETIPKLQLSSEIDL